jgi:hypothetical protein
LPACVGDPYQRLRGFLKAEVILAQRSGNVLAAENFRERLVIWTNNSGGIDALRLEDMPPPPLS